MKIFYTVLSLVCYNHLVASLDPPDDYKLELVQALFRHGDRIPDRGEIYDTDPHDEIYKSFGYGELTKVGQQREYRIGELLRERYGNFLGDFKNRDVYAYSTNVDRTKMSLQLVLAGLYRPTNQTSWSDQINWLPIPTHYEQFETSFLTSFGCPGYRQLQQQVGESTEFQEKFEKYQDFLQSLRNKTGVTTSTPFVAVMLYNNLHAAASMSLPRPPWYSKGDYEKMEEIAAAVFQTMTQTDTMKRTMGGLIIDKFLANINNDEGRKLFLYAAHDLNVAAFTNVHNFTGIPRIPDYGSTIIFEKLRGGKDNQTYIRMYLWTGVSEKLIPLKLDKCETTCLLSDYTNIVKPLMPDNLARQCTSMRSLCRARSSATRDTDIPLQLAHLFAGKDLPSFKHMKDYVVPST